MKTQPEQFIKFHQLLMSNAPKGYEPWYFPVVKDNKAPDGYAISQKAGPKCWICNEAWTPNKKGELICPICEITKTSWKAPHARLSFEEALQRLKQGYNVGIAARSFDPLVIIDIDDYEFTNQMPNTLTIRSRKRYGLHGFCWEVKNEEHTD